MPFIIRLSLVCLPLLAIVSFIVAGPGPKADTPPRGYVCMMAGTPPLIDGKLDDAVWKAAKWSDDFVDIEGEIKPKPEFRTRMKMLWDDKALYIAAELEEPHIWANLTKHDSVIFQDPDFEVFIDPDGDNHLYGELELNAKNTTWDLLLSKPYKDGGKALNAWEIIGLKTAVHINGTLNDSSDSDKSWTVEIAWPWEGLKEISHTAVPPKDGDQWRINFSRVEWDTIIENGKYLKVKGKPEHNWVWSPQGVIDMHRPERWGYLQFSTKTNGDSNYKPDSAQGIKDLLHQVYYSQREYYKKHQKFTSSMADLEIPKTSLGVPDIKLSSKGFEASMKIGDKLWGIDSDSLLWKKGK
ncbi:MAG: hypothetical protein CK551_07635 [Planctomycetaceae bacterium]|nr:hypothetical protein [Gemmataceae bacterium]PHX63123.1 MAG: hypothetical protein CK551_07635 [Planctomycetaceae bacterium]